MSSAGVVAVVRHGLPDLRFALRGVRETVPPEAEIAVVALDAWEYDATYLLRQHMRGRLAALEFDHAARLGGHCGLDRSLRLVHGDFVARVDDTHSFRPGWLERAVEVLERDDSLGCLSLVPPADYHRGRGRPRTVNVEPVEVDHLEMSCFVTRRELLDRRACAPVKGHPEACGLQETVRRGGRRLAFLPGLVSPLEVPEMPRGFDDGVPEADLPPHEGAAGAMRRLERSYDLGDDVLLSCMGCGAPELEVLAARIRLCEQHQVAVGFWYELRCPECWELHYQDDVQFRCPG